MLRPSSAECKSKQTELQRVNHQISLYINKINNEQQRIEQLSETIGDNEAKLMLQRRSQSLRGIKDNAAGIKRQISTLENRLNQSMISFNTKVMANKELRQSIDELRKERVRFDEIFTKLEYEVQANADKMKRVLEEGKKRIKMRDEALNEVEVLKKQLNDANTSLLSYQEELANADFKKDDRERQLVATERDELNISTAESYKSERKQIIDASKHEGQCLDEAFAKVKELTGVDDVDILIQKLSEMDELNFSRFNYITQELGVEGTLDYQIAEAKQELDMACLDSIAKKQQEAMLKCWKQHEIKERMKDVEVQHKQKLETWEKIKDSIKMACLEVPLPCHLAALDGITKNNVMEYLAAIESKAITVIQAMRDDDGSESSQCSPIDKLQTGPADNNINYDVKPLDARSLLPITDFVQDDIEEDADRPLTIEELQSSIMKFK